MAQHPVKITGENNVIEDDGSIPWETDKLEDLLFVQL